MFKNQYVDKDVSNSLLVVKGSAIMIMKYAISGVTITTMGYQWCKCRNENI